MLHLITSPSQVLPHVWVWVWNTQTDTKPWSGCWAHIGPPTRTAGSVARGHSWPSSVQTRQSSSGRHPDKRGGRLDVILCISALSCVFSVCVSQRPCVMPVTVNVMHVCAEVPSSPPGMKNLILFDYHTLLGVKKKKSTTNPESTFSWDFFYSVLFGWVTPDLYEGSCTWTVTYSQTGDDGWVLVRHGGRVGPLEHPGSNAVFTLGSVGVHMWTLCSHLNSHAVYINPLQTVETIAPPLPPLSSFTCPVDRMFYKGE